MPTFEFRGASPAEQPADLMILPVYEGPEAGPGVREVAGALGVDVLALLEGDRVRGRVGDSFLVPTLGRGSWESILLVGVGPRDRAGPGEVRRAAGRVASRATRYRRVATTLPQAARRSFDEAVHAFVEGLLLGSYRFDRYKGGEDDDANPQLERVVVLGTRRHDPRRARQALRRGEIFAQAAAWARDLVNTPAIDATPELLAGEAQKMARAVGLRSKVWTKADLERGGFGGVLGVGRGSANPPRLIELRYESGRGTPVALAGKGITFDSGGLSIKDSKGMEWMKADMAGAATVLATMRAVALLKPKVGVVAVIPTSENMPGGSAIRPGDVLRHRGGKTSEVLNTDAEGRLILADALAYLSEQRPRSIVDVATLTGACMVALGEDLWGVMGTDDRVVRDLLAAGDRAGEPGWQLPLWRPYRRQIESSVADVKNIGNRWGGAITAALFLKEFVDEVPWAHVDIAGTAYSERAGDFWPRGATGNPVRTLIHYVERQAASDGRRPRR